MSDKLLNQKVAAHIRAICALTGWQAALPKDGEGKINGVIMGTADFLDAITGEDSIKHAKPKPVRYQ